MGKTAESATALNRECRAYQQAGALAVEIEVVSAEVAAAISARLDLLLWSMGAGASCDALYLFACDILGDHRAHVPRHSKVYRNFAAEYDRLQTERIAAFTEFRHDVEASDFPEDGHVLRMTPAELAAFEESLGATTP